MSHGAETSAVARDGTTIFLAAASSGKLDAIKYVVDELKPSPSALKSRLENGQTALHLAFFQESISGCKYLMEHQMGHLESLEGQLSPLTWAVERGWIEGVKLVLGSGLTLTEQERAELIEDAMDNGHKAVAELLASHGAPNGSARIVI